MRHDNSAELQISLRRLKLDSQTNMFVAVPFVPERRRNLGFNQGIDDVGLSASLESLFQVKTSSASLYSERKPKLVFNFA